MRDISDQGLLKLHVPLRRGRGLVCMCVCGGGGMEQSPKEGFLWNGKIRCKEASQDLLISWVYFGGGLEGSNREKMGRKQKEEVLYWNAGKRRLRARENPLEFSPSVTVLWKLSLLKGEYLLRRKVGWDRVAYWSQRCQWLLILLLSFQSHFMGCIHVCLEKKKEGLGGEGGGEEILGWSRCWVSV